jgi:hypothetical protein
VTPFPFGVSVFVYLAFWTRLLSPTFLKVDKRERERKRENFTRLFSIRRVTVMTGRQVGAYSESPIAAGRIAAGKGSGLRRERA